MIGHIIEYLSEALDVPAYAEVPESAPDTFLVVDQTGTETTNWITRMTVAIQSYEQTLYAASVLNERVIEAMESMPHYGGVHLITDYQFNSPVAKQYRYQAVFEITYNRRANNG